MYELIAAALLLGLDSAIVSAAVGATGIDRPRQNRLAAAFGLCDGVASLIGFYLIGSVVAGRFEGLAHWVGPAAVAGYALLVLATARSARAIVLTTVARRAGLLYLLPLLMSTDNLFCSSSMVHGAPPLASAAILGIVSGLESVCGFRLGALISAGFHKLGDRPKTQPGRPLIGGLALLSAAAALALI
jgi:putative Mn2+ efflux pump MntP